MPPQSNSHTCLTGHTIQLTTRDTTRRTRQTTQETAHGTEKTGTHTTDRDSTQKTTRFHVSVLNTWLNTEVGELGELFPRFSHEISVLLRLT